MQPNLSLLTPDLIARILDEAFQLMMNPGIKVQSAEAIRYLQNAGASVDESTEVVHIPETVVRKALDTVPSVFHLYDLHGIPKVQYGGDAVHFDPGSSGVHILDPETLEHKPSYTPDLIRVVKVAEMLPQIDAQSTAIVCNEMPKTIGDMWRLYVVLMYSEKPIVTGAFSIKTLESMLEMLSILSGGRKALAEKPRRELPHL
jgi:trimethylamine--corrinoid protein Co-methyltransferase